MGAALDYFAGGEAGYTGSPASNATQGEYWGEFWRQAGQSVQVGLNRWIDNEVNKATGGGQPAPAIGGAAPKPQGSVMVGGFDVGEVLPWAVAGLVAIIVLPKLLKG